LGRIAALDRAIMQIIRPAWYQPKAVHKTTKGSTHDCKRQHIRLQKAAHTTTKGSTHDYKRQHTRLQKAAHKTTKGSTQDYKRQYTRLQKAAHTTPKGSTQDSKRQYTRLQKAVHKTTPVPIARGSGVQASPGALHNHARSYVSTRSKKT
jgi:exonuclease VII large subunit